MFAILSQFVFHTLCALTRDNCFPYNPVVIPDVSNILDHGQIDRNDEVPVVSIDYGSVEGYIMRTIKNRPFAAFEGIPYGKPPIGKLRFRAPVPTDPWHGVKKTKKVSSPCLQLDALQYYRIYGEEDCLYMNVYTPKLTRQSDNPNVPTIVFIHGGGHFFGTSSLYGPAFFMDQDIILVTFNYRLGVLGYLATGDRVSPGNYALKDQALALHFIKQNIRYFGGHPQRITIMGQSAGAVGVGLHLISHQTRNLIYAGIMHSGSPLAPWAIVNHTIESTRRIGKAFDCPTDDSYRLVECLRSQNPYFLVERQSRVYTDLRLPVMPFGPVVEPFSDEAFLIESPEVAYQNKNVSKAPVIIGHVKNEGDFLFAYMYVRQWLFRFISPDSRKKLYPLVYEYNHMPSLDKERISEKIEQYYIQKGNGRFNYWNRKQISDSIGDRYFACPARQAMEYHSKITTTYGFYFDYYGKYSSLETLALDRNDWGISHIDDLQYFLNSTFYFKPFNTNDEEFKVSQVLINIWTNFAYKGIPLFTLETGKDIEIWKPVKAKALIPLVLEINGPKPKMVKYPSEQNYKFWQSLNITNKLIV